MKNQYFIIFLFSVIFVSCSLLRSGEGDEYKRIKPFKISTKKSRKFSDLRRSEKELKPKVLEVDEKKIRKIIENPHQKLSIQVPIKKWKKLNLELKRTDSFTTGFKIDFSSNFKSDEEEQGIYYQGKIKDDKNSFVSVCFFNNEIIGFINSDKYNLVIGKLKGQNWKNEHIIFNDHFVFDKNPLKCSTSGESFSYTKESLEFRALPAMTNNDIEFSIEVDFDVFTAFGNEQNTLNYITALLNQVHVIFQNEGINSSVSELKIWNSPSPYFGNTSEEYLKSFQDKSTSHRGDLAQLLTLRNFGGIAAGFDGICNCNPDKKKSVSGIFPFFQNVPIYSFSVNIIAHEFGHLMGSRHTHACVWNGNNTAIDGCAGRTEGNCIIPPHPIGGGTIMSYCHNSPVGINFNLGFGQQPGNVIRSNISRADCTNRCISTGIITAFESRGIYYSPDGFNLGGGGNTGGSIYPGRYKVIKMVPFKNGIITAFDNNVIYYNEDGTKPGSGEIVYNGNQKVRAMIPFKNGIVTAFESGGIYYSPDGFNLGGGGNTGGSIYPGRYKVIEMIPFRNGIVTAFDNNVIYYNEDGTNPGSGYILYSQGQRVRSMIPF